MKKSLFSKEWNLKCSSFDGVIDLPNDYAIKMPRSASAEGGASNGFFQSGGRGEYRKKVRFDNASNHYILQVDGAYMCSEAHLNDFLIEKHPHGYTPYLVDLTPHIDFEKENELMLVTNGIQPSTRWYSGAGLYRDVFMWEGGDIRIEPWDIFVTTPKADTVDVSYLLSSDRDAFVTLTAEILDDGKVIKSYSLDLSVSDTEKTPVNISLKLENANTWSPDSPYLYKVRSTISENGSIVDIDERKFGIRTITADAKNGLRINGKQIKLHGGCIHHDHGVLGAQDFPDACRRKLTLLKSVGFNAVRIAHNPPSEQLLEMCDEMGILVMDEAFDCWRVPKGGMFNYHMWFDGNWDKDIACMVLRDRNHPCVISYSIGNEIPEAYGRKDGPYLSARLSNEIRKYDGTRFVTSCVANFAYGEEFAQKSKDFFAPLDICGYNYLYTQYEQDHERFPERVIWGSETHALKFFDSWQLVEKNSYVLGDFTWTAYDNLGEAGTGNSKWARDGEINEIYLEEYPWRLCYQGDFDLCGFRRPQSYFREAIWKKNTPPRIFTTHPEHYGEGFTGTGWHWYDVHECWTFDDKYIGKPVKCDIYSVADEIRWFLNGKEVGVSKPQKATATLDIPYEKGELAVIAYKDGKECGRCSLCTVGEAKELEATPEVTEIKADNRSLCYIRITIKDTNGNTVTHVPYAVRCTVDGGELMGIFSGNPANEDEYGSNLCHTFEGHALAIVRTANKGDLKVTLESDGLSSATATIKAI